MNILFLNSAKEWGGNEKWSLLAAQGLSGRGHRVFFGCRSSLFALRAGSTRVTFVRFPFLNHADLITAAALYVFMLRKRIDVLVPTKQREYLLGGLAAWPLAGVRVIARLGIDRPLHNLRNRFAFTHLFDGVIVNSQKIVEALSRTLGFDTGICRVVPNGVAIPQLSPDVRKTVRYRLGIDENEFLICGAGRLAPQKGFDYAIEAFARVHEKAPDTRLLIAGEGPMLDEYRNLAASRRVAGQVIFAGFRDDVPALLQAADLFWLTSRSEGMPNALLEAMAAGRAAVAFDVAGVPEVITDGKNGIIVRQGDVEVLSEKTVGLISDYKRRNRLSVEARKTMEKDFSIGAMIDRLEEFL